jgi:RND family efflux transporter MFP subunit
MAELDAPEVVAELEQKRAMVEQATAIRGRSSAAVKVAEAQVLASEARLNEAQAGIKRAGADYNRWQSEHTRIEQLFRERAQTGSLLDETRMKLQAAESAREEADAHVKTAQAAVALNKAMLDQAQADITVNNAAISIARSDAQRVAALLNYTQIVAPFDGVVTRRNVDTGHLTVPGAQGEPLFIVARADIVTVSLGVPELFAAAVDIGDPARIRLQAMPGQTIEGKVSRTAYALDSRSRTLRTEIDLPNTDGKLHPGLYAHAVITLDERKDPLTLPTSAIGRDGPQAFCMAVREGRTVKLPIELGLSDGTRAEILSGLNGDETVVKTYSPSLAEGQPVLSMEPARSTVTKSKP